MARRRKPSAFKRRLLLGIAIVLLSAVLAVCLTEPRQLPARVADHQAVRTAYQWRDTVSARVYNWIYPLAHLREDAPASAGKGYSNDARDAMDALIEEKGNNAP